MGKPLFSITEESLSKVNIPFSVQLCEGVNGPYGSSRGGWDRVKARYEAYSSWNVWINLPPKLLPVVPRGVALLEL